MSELLNGTKVPASFSPALAAPRPHGLPCFEDSNSTTGYLAVLALSPTRCLSRWTVGRVVWQLPLCNRFVAGKWGNPKPNITNQRKGDWLSLLTACATMGPRELCFPCSRHDSHPSLFLRGSERDVWQKGRACLILTGILQFCLFSCSGLRLDLFCKEKLCETSGIERHLASCSHGPWHCTQVLLGRHGS